jgi:NADH-quinone oxidoreductase subunit C
MSLLEVVTTLLRDAIIDSHAAHGDTTILVASDTIVDTMRALKTTPELAFNMLMDLTAVDYLRREPRFEVVYHLVSLEIEPRATEPAALNRRLRVKAGVPEEPCEIASIADVWPAANWMEREVFDLYGIRFRGHPDLRRILLYDGFEGYPLRKDYPKERRQPLIGPRN